MGGEEKEKAGVGRAKWFGGPSAKAFLGARNSFRRR